MKHCKWSDSSKNKKPWYVEWFDETYLDVYRHRDENEAREQVDLIIDTLHLHREIKILDLGCGEGRYTSIFHEKGFTVLGIDLSKCLIGCASKKNPNLLLAVGDMRAIPGKFDLVLSLFTSFGYFEDEIENRHVIREIHSALNSGGYLWLDFFNADYVRSNFLPENRFELSGNIDVIEKREILNNRIVKNITLTEKGKPENTKSYRESVRLYSKNDLEEIMEESGLRVIQCFGDYKGNEWTTGSERTIIIGRRNT